MFGFHPGAGDPAAEDPAIEHYWSLRPLRFTEVESFEFRRPVPWTDLGALVLRMRLRDPEDANSALALEFFGVNDLELQMSSSTQTPELAIVSLAGRGWEYVRYGVDTGASPNLHFYCRVFTATLVPVEPEQ